MSSINIWKRRVFCSFVPKQKNQKFSAPRAAFSVTFRHRKVTKRCRSWAKFFEILPEPRRLFYLRRNIFKDFFLFPLIDVVCLALRGYSLPKAGKYTWSSENTSKTFLKFCVEYKKEPPRLVSGHLKVPTHEWAVLVTFAATKVPENALRRVREL